MEIVVYKAEQEAGLESQIRANASVAWQSDVQLCEAFDLGGAKASLLPEHAVAENKNQIDLHYLRTVMVSSAWNLNDDIFTPEEMWLARATPEDKPFNYMHEQSDIIGHITNAVAVDESMRPIPEDTPSDKLPEHYHIVTNAVLYKFWEKPELQERMNRLIAEIADNRWFVSMEALGKGLVSKPANPESVILEASKASGYELPREETHTMSAEIETIQAEAAEAKAKSEKLEAELAAANEKLAQVEAEKRLARLTASVADKLEADAAQALAIATALSGLTDEAFEAAVASANEYMAAKLAAYKGQADKAKAAEDLTATVEALKAQVEELKKIAAEITPAPKGLGEANPPKPAPVMSIPMDKGAVPPEAAPVVATVLENVIPSDEPALAGTVANQSVNKVAAQIAAFFGADDAETKIEAE